MKSRRFVTIPAVLLMTAGIVLWAGPAGARVYSSEEVAAIAAKNGGSGTSNPGAPGQAMPNDGSALRRPAAPNGPATPPVLDRPPRMTAAQEIKGVEQELRQALQDLDQLNGLEAEGASGSIVNGRTKEELQRLIAQAEDRLADLQGGGPGRTEDVKKMQDYLLGRTRVVEQPEGIERTKQALAGAQDRALEFAQSLFGQEQARTTGSPFNPDASPATAGVGGVSSDLRRYLYKAGQEAWSGTAEAVASASIRSRELAEKLWNPVSGALSNGADGWASMGERALDAVPQARAAAAWAADKTFGPNTLAGAYAGLLGDIGGAALGATGHAVSWTADQGLSGVNEAYKYTASSMGRAYLADMGVSQSEIDRRVERFYEQADANLARVKGAQHLAAEALVGMVPFMGAQKLANAQKAVGAADDMARMIKNADVNPAILTEADDIALGHALERRAKVSGLQKDWNAFHDWNYSDELDLMRLENAARTQTAVSRAAQTASNDLVTGLAPRGLGAAKMRAQAGHVLLPGEAAPAISRAASRVAERTLAEVEPAISHNIQLVNLRLQSAKQQMSQLAGGQVSGGQVMSNLDYAMQFGTPGQAAEAQKLGRMLEGTLADARARMPAVKPLASQAQPRLPAVSSAGQIPVREQIVAGRIGQEAVEQQLLANPAATAADLQTASRNARADLFDNFADAAEQEVERFMGTTGYADEGLASLAQREAEAYRLAAQQARSGLPPTATAQPAKPMTVFSGGQSDAQALKQTWTSQPGNEVASPTTPARSAFFDRHPLDLQMFASDAGVTGAQPSRIAAGQVIPGTMGTATTTAGKSVTVQTTTRVTPTMERAVSTIADEAAKHANVTTAQTAGRVYSREARALAQDVLADPVMSAVDMEKRLSRAVAYRDQTMGAKLSVMKSGGTSAEIGAANAEILHANDAIAIIERELNQRTGRPITTRTPLSR